jgi:uncharacterized lipoprotein YbaY
MSRRARTALMAVMLAAWAVIPGATTLAATTVVNGVIVSDEQLTLSPDAVAVVTLVDQTATEGAGVIVGEQRIEPVAALPTPFAVLYDDATIDDTHSYALFASIVDGDKVYQSAEAVPVITGGPRVNVEIPVAPAPAYPAAIEGTVVRPADAELTNAAVELAVLVKEDTGTVVSVAPIVDVPATDDIPISVGYDPELVDPAARYVIRAAIVDGGSVWEARRVRRGPGRPSRRRDPGPADP